MGSRWVIGDIHGCIATFQAMVEKEIGLQPDDTLFLLGDLIDRGPDSKAVIDYILRLQEQAYDVRSIIGNHEVMLLDAIRSERQYILWMSNAGMTTLHNFGIDMERYPGPEGVRRIPARYLDFFQQMPYYIESEGFFLVHAGLNPESLHPLDDTDTMIWTRREAYHSDFLKGRKLIHGHSPLHREEILRRLSDRDAQIYNLDGGCLYTDFPGLGNLVAMNIDSGESRMVRNLE